MKKVVKAIGVLSVASLMSTSAFSQISVSGYAEVGFLAGSTEGTRSTGNSKNLGGESVITVAGKGSLNNGWTYSAYQNIDSDDVNNGRDIANASPMTTRAIVLSPNANLNLFYTYDGVYGGEIARTAVPTLTERVVDLTGATTLAEFIDVTSGTHAIGFDVLNVGPAGRLSVAYAPNLDATQSQSSDRLYSGTAQAGINSASGYSIGYSVTPGPIRIAAGYTKIDAKQIATAVDPTSRTLGITYTAANFAIGAQRTQNADGRKIAGVIKFDDKVDTFSANFKATKDVTLGATYSKMERDVNSGGVNSGNGSGPDTKVMTVGAAYNLGPVVASIQYEDAKDKNLAGNEISSSGLDHKLTKIKVKANF
jgi:predicted porin